MSITPCEVLEQPDRAGPSLHQAAGETRFRILVVSDGLAHVTGLRGNEPTTQGASARNNQRGYRWSKPLPRSGLWLGRLTPRHAAAARPNSPPKEYAEFLQHNPHVGY